MQTISASAKENCYQLLSSLYGRRADFESWWLEFATAVDQLAQARPPALRQLDAERTRSPDWFLSERMLGYCAYTERFAGSLAGVAKRIPHLKSLGVTYLHLLPFYLTREGGEDANDGGFAIADFEQIAPHLGSMQDLAPLCQQLRDAGISLCADFVLNHVADTHPWALAAKQGDKKYLDYFRSFPDRSVPEQYEQSLGEVFPETAPGNFTYHPESGRWFWTTFYPYQWDLNYENPQVFSEIALTLLRLANRGVEIFRLDSAPFLWKRLGSNCMNLPEAHTLLSALRALCAWAAPAVLLKSEAIVPAAQAAAYLGTEGREECQIAYHGALMASAWASLVEQNVALVQAVIAATAKAPRHTSWLTYVRCHDDIVWSTLKPQVQDLGGDYLSRVGHVSRFLAGQVEGSYAHGLSFQTAGNSEAVHGTNGMCAALTGYSAAARYAQERILILYALACAHGGVPVIYMGDELGQGNDADGWHRQDSRWVHRPYWDESLFEASPSLLQEMKALFQKRAAHPDFAAGQPLQLLDSACPAVLLFKRGQNTLCAFNFSDAEQELKSLDLRLAPWTYRFIAMK